MQRRADLLDLAAVERDDPVGQRHGLDLVVRDVDHRRAELAVQPLDLEPHLHPQRRVEVGKRFVEQEHFGLADDGSPDGDALPLPARQLRGRAREQVVEPQDPRRFPHAPVDLVLAEAGELQIERDVVVDIHMRV